MELNHLRIGRSGVITRVDGEGALRRRLLDMGLTPKTRVYVRKVAPLGDPIEINLRGYELTLRAEDAAKIHITPVENHPHHLNETTHSDQERRHAFYVHGRKGNRHRHEGHSDS